MSRALQVECEALLNVEGWKDRCAEGKSVKRKRRHGGAVAASDADPAPSKP